MVSDHGRVRSLTRFVPHLTSGRQLVRGRLLSLCLDGKGYPRLILRIGGRVKSWAVHRAVLVAFQPREDWEQMHVNHKDGNTTNNHISNLEWCTASENRLHSYRVLKTPNPAKGRFGELHHLSKPVLGVCISTGERRLYKSTHECTKDGFKKGEVNACISGRQKSHQGWLWYRPDEVPEAPSYEPGNSKGLNNGNAHAVECIGPDGSIKRYDYAALAVIDGFNPVGISHVIVGRQKRHRGCEWRLANG